MRHLHLLENRLTRKLSAFVRLSRDDQTALDKVWTRTCQDIAAQHDLIREGDQPLHIRLILDGWACRYKTLEDGRRQIIGYFLPGDMCDLNVFILKRMDHSIKALNPVKCVALTPADFDELTVGHPRVMQALWWETLVSASIQREWTVNLGQRSALERLAHLLCELFVRLRAVGLTARNSCELPLTQIELADTLGLTAVHVSRTIKELRSRDLILLHDRQLEIPDLEALRRIAMFDADYLHLEREGAHLDASL